MGGVGIRHGWKENLPDIVACRFNKSSDISTGILCFVSMVTVSPFAGLKQSMPTKEIYVKNLSNLLFFNFFFQLTYSKPSADDKFENL